MKQLRIKFNLTQKGLGSLLQVHRKTISKWEAEKAYPTRENYMKLIKYFP
ncbi:helix-turn-helix transcriptional regulator [Tepidimicrobium xylanilyticum]